MRTGGSIRAGTLQISLMTHTTTDQAIKTGKAWGDITAKEIIIEEREYREGLNDIIDLEIILSGFLCIFLNEIGSNSS